MNLIDTAAEMAALAHEGQHRKAGGIPYIAHPCATAVHLAHWGYGEEAIAAALVHDVVEDTSYTLEDIKKSLGPKVARLVKACTEPDKSQSWLERKEHTLSVVERTRSRDIKAIICADKAHNLRCMEKELELKGEKAWEQFRQGREAQSWFYQALCHLTRNQREEPFVGLRATVSRVFKIKR